MAWALCAFTNFPPSVHKPITITSKTLASVSLRSPSKRAKRKNHLRPKILKTLTKPYSIEILRDQQLEFYNEGFFEEVSLDMIRQVEEENVEIQLESLVSCAPQTAEAGVSNAIGVVSSRSVLELAFYFLGLFIFQTVCTVWVLGSADMGRETGNGETEAESLVSLLEMQNGKRKDFLLKRIGQNFLGSKPGDVNYVDKSQFEDKIVEIRAMAREAKEYEARKLRANGVDSFLEDALGNGLEEAKNKNSIQEEVNERLVKLEKRQEKLPMASISYLIGSVKVEDRKDSEKSETKEKVGELVFKKKLKFRSSLAGHKNKTKGFNGSKHSSLPNDNSRGATIRDQSPIDGNNRNNGLDLSGQEKQLDLSHSDSWKTVSPKMEKELHCLTNETSGENMREGLETKQRRKETLVNELGSSQSVGKKLQKEGGSSRREIRNGVENSGAGTGGVQETNYEKHFTGLTKPRELTKLKTQASQSLTKENQNISRVCYSRASLSGNGNSSLPSETREIENDFWWLKLPYALGILLNRGSDCEGQRGLYSLKISSNPQDTSCASYTVAFEDRTDATNFSYLLESFFEDLGDCSANVVPLSIKELNESVKSNVRKVVVVRKGQVKLFAGQPLGEVEMVLRSLIQRTERESVD
ncbi:uncharacterized protein LOC122660436 [Telopea speciosissima]|uniref:uncharacterized protein LOC122660436 n=1 Tax=Telopea speciosissima TaxID=54955 RepID=UPI001CC7C49B|nr:uncharacterized protein LOC122660436 [Telopea speciosissima]